ncbi:hypothetical protein HNQ80_002275 [Anaerosolibacter carboniphilus]|uniref:DUF4173 domain-containing protein n=1 Tax=Anaerosolibacter carboniphilus TaxID=1417629 RepID=A0A841KRK2_9FIRM|nr:DUF4173 domain-containing protein [Anaerosolibacter carboniphilus]MBB6216176.1 hypothetical protein [Anaerosolibacter carboniphilus]
MIKEGRLLSYSILWGILFNFFFYRSAVGISFPIFIGVSFYLFIRVLKDSDRFKVNRIWLFAVPITLLSLRFFLSSNYIFHFFNFLVILFLFIGMALVLSGKEKSDYANIGFPFKIIGSVFAPIAYFTKPYTYLYQRWVFGKTENNYTELKKIILGILISLPLLLVILSLLSSADMVFQEMLFFIPTKLSKLFDNTVLADYFRQLLLIVFMATYTYGFIWFLFIPKKIPIGNTSVPETAATASVKAKTNFFDGTILMTILVIVNAVYLIFCSIQFAFLFSGGFNTLPGNFTYAAYARQGFFQLLLVTMLNFSIILFSFYGLNPNQVSAQRWIKRLLFLMGIFTYIMIYSSYYRMGLYQQQYGYTYLRIFVYFFLSLETVLLTATLIYIFKPRFHLAKFYIITVLAFYVGLNYLNLDAMIARNNIDRYFETGKVDIHYITTLSYDAVPELTRLLESKDFNIQQALRYYYDTKGSIARQKATWKEFNLSRHKAVQAMSTWRFNN